MIEQYTETVFPVNPHYTSLAVPLLRQRANYAVMEFTANLKRYRGQRGWNQGDLAEQIGVAQATVQRWESGKREPSHADLEKLAAAFKVSVSALFREPGEAPLPTRDELVRMIQAAMAELPLGVTFSDYPEAVASGLHDRLVLFQASGGFRSRQEEETVEGTDVRFGSTTSQASRAGPRTQ